MEKILIDKLRSYLSENNLDVLLQLQEEMRLTTYLEDKVAAHMPLLEQWIAEGKPRYILEELSMNVLTEDLRPSRFLYVRGVLAEDFLQSYERYRELGVLTYEIINMLAACKPVFETIGLTQENENDRALRYAVIGTIEEYLNPPA